MSSNNYFPLTTSGLQDINASDVYTTNLKATNITCTNINGAPYNPNPTNNFAVQTTGAYAASFANNTLQIATPNQNVNITSTPTFYSAILNTNASSESSLEIYNATDFPNGLGIRPCCRITSYDERVMIDGGAYTDANNVPKFRPVEFMNIMAAPTGNITTLTTTTANITTLQNCSTLTATTSNITTLQNVSTLNGASVESIINSSANSLQRVLQGTVIVKYYTDNPVKKSIIGGDLNGFALVDNGLYLLTLVLNSGAPNYLPIGVPSIYIINTGQNPNSLFLPNTNASVSQLNIFGYAQNNYAFEISHRVTNNKDAIVIWKTINQSDDTLNFCIMQLCVPNQ